ncbi:glycosyltransferase family 2 protein [Vibrio paucivorans]
MDTNLPSTSQHSAPMVSVIITCFNYERFIRSSIESVLNQDYPNLELIVVDDCSSDSSRDIIMEYHPQLIPVFHDKNQGHGGAFNNGYAAANGDIIMFLDADDYLLPNALQQAVEAFPVSSGMCQFRMHLVDDHGEQYDIFPKPELAFDHGARAKRKLLHSGQYQSTVTSGLLFRRSLMEQLMPMPQEKFRQGGDGYLVTLAPLYTDISSSDYCMSAYRQHGENHSGFASQMTKRAKWRLEHNQMRYDALKQASYSLGVKLEDKFWYNDSYHLIQMMCLSLFEPEHTPATSRTNLAQQAIKNVNAQNLSVLNKAILTLWWLSISITPRPLAKSLYSWKVMASTRPKAVQKVFSILRRA